ncbi:M48 family metallopeptidase [bacterium]|nr:M48 family metallopeptidase [bacterium]MBR5625132.1 M48 family metallopeptidase [bacterium]
MAERKSIHDCIAANKRKSVFFVALLAILLTAFCLALSAFFPPEEQGFIVFLSLIFVAVYILFGYFQGSAAIMALSGAKEADPRVEKQLYNVVEEMTIAGGLPMPKVYIMEEAAPNAFATGRNPKDSAVAVTRGLLQKLNRDELQGVIAHELSHIRHYDILFSTLVCVLVGAVAMIARFAWRFMIFGGSRKSSSRKGGGQGLVIILALALMIFAPILSTIVQLAISREREYLADAGAVSLTRNPEGLARALEKIAGDPGEVKGASGATRALYIAEPFKKSFFSADSLFSTHPPIEKRVARLRAMS